MLYKVPGRQSRARIVRRRAVAIIRTPDRRGVSRLRRVEVCAQLGQAFVAAVALLLAVPGAIFVMKTYDDQQKLIRGQQVLNRDQVALNAIALQRNERRYASKVSFWEAGTFTKNPDPREHVTLVKIRNMTTLPITDVVLVGAGSIRDGMPPPHPDSDGGAGYRPLVEPGTIAPCQEVNVWVKREHLHSAWLRMFQPQAPRIDILDVPTWSTASMRFVVAGNDWESTARSLEPVGDRFYDGVRSEADFVASRITGKEVAGDAVPIGDCGENG